MFARHCSGLYTAHTQRKMALPSGTDARILIIGCGISGIGAAQKLSKQGFRNVRVIEATSRSGGRIKTGRMGKRKRVNT